MGPLALAFKKKKDNRELYLTVEGEGFAFMVEVDAKKGADARKFAAWINSYASQWAQRSRRAEPGTKGTTAEPGETENDIAAQLTKMAELRSNGLLSDEEFSAAKSQLLGLG